MNERGNQNKKENHRGTQRIILNRTKKEMNEGEKKKGSKIRKKRRKRYNGRRHFNITSK